MTASLRLRTKLNNMSITELRELNKEIFNDGSKKAGVLRYEIKRILTNKIENLKSEIF